MTARSLISSSKNQAEQVQKTVPLCVCVCVCVCFKLLDSKSLNRKLFTSDFVRRFTPKRKWEKILNYIYFKLSEEYIKHFCWGRKFN